MNKQKTKSMKTKDNLCNSYLDLLKDKNINQITIKEITDHAGYNRGTFYIYYRDVYDLHDKIKKDVLTKIENTMTKTLKNEKNIHFETIFKTITELFIQNEKTLTILIIKDSSLAADIKAKFKPILKNVFNKDIKNKKIDYVIEYHLSSLFGIITLWLAKKKEISIDELFNLIKNIVSKGVLNVMMQL